MYTIIYDIYIYMSYTSIFKIYILGYSNRKVIKVMSTNVLKLQGYHWFAGFFGFVEFKDINQNSTFYQSLEHNKFTFFLLICLKIDKLI